MRKSQLRNPFLQGALWTALATGAGFAQSNPSPIPYETSKIEAGYGHSLAITQEGVLWSWGRNTYGALGDGTTTQRNSPVHLIFGPYTGLRFKAISASAHSAAIDTQGRLWVWGRNDAGQVGDGTTTNRNKPLEIPVNGGLAKIASVACGESHTVAADIDGNLWAWGDNTYGALGNGSGVSSLRPVAVPAPSGMGKIVQVAAGEGSSYALDITGKIWAWGRNSDGQLGDNSTTNRSTPVPLYAATPSYRAVSAKGSHAAALGADDTIWTWGLNSSGQLGLGDLTNRHRRYQVGTPTYGKKIAAGKTHTLVGSDYNLAWAWGNNGSGRLGNGSTSNSPSPVQVSTSSSLNVVVNVAAGEDHSLAVRSQGALYAWGAGTYGQLGNGGTTASSLPVAIPGLRLENDDSDNDLLPDSWEKFYYGNLLKAGTSDSDGDGVTARNEYLNNTNPTLADTDGDGISDNADAMPLDPANGSEDADGDGLTLAEEIAKGTNPWNPDTDGDGINDKDDLQPLVANDAGGIGGTLLVLTPLE